MAFSSFFQSTLAALSIAMPLSAAAAVPADSNPLAAERWKTRPVVVVVPQAGDALLRKVETALRKTTTREAFIEREMVLYTVVAGEGRRNHKQMAPAQTRALLAALKLDAAGPPTFVLVGKDGGVKLTEGPQVDLQAVFAEIDRMPMRQR
ncbi:DUF4174 domain-containing protein [Variovorax sp. H27-G14]|uniref:DUF4174 domain-containing protein n=1 Tax=Variovorax sp. H27-G14 TaxID=3111914 RepID=UPI0038FC5B17